MKITKLDKVLSTVDDVRLLTKTAMGLPISDSIKDLASLLSTKVPWCLCGGLAVGVYARPRGTDDIDILLPNDGVLQYVYAITSSLFKKASDHVITHRQTGVAADLVTPEFVNVNPSVVNKAIETASMSVVGSVSIPVVSREGLVALKLNRAKYLDLADIESIIRAGGKVDLSGYVMTESQMQTLKKIEQEIDKNNA
jgi:hypothetical protein